MKKFFALLICSIVTVTALATVVNDDAKSKFEAATTIVMASAGGVVLAPSRSREKGTLAKLRDKYGKDRVIAKSFIRMEAYLTNGKSEYEFVHRMLGNESSTERKLNDQDAFVIEDIGIFLLKESTAVPGIGVLQTYPNPQQFADEVGYLQNEHLEHIYNGYVTAKIGDTTWLPDLPIFRCRVVNTAQQSAVATNDSEKHPYDGFTPCTPEYTLKGRENNSLKLVVPASSLHKVESNSGTTNIRTKVVMILTGFKITGAGNA